MIRLTIPAIDEDCIAAVREVLESGFLVQGERVAAFESAVSEYIGASHAIAVNSGTSALHLALLAVGICPGDRVVVPAYSYPATANAVVLCGAEPVFVDIERDTFNMDPQALEAVLEELTTGDEAEGRGQPAEAVLVVHTFGQMADVGRIGEIASDYGVPVLEDAACALGATWGGCQAGTCGIAGCFSFHPRKAITTGEGGMVVTDDAVLAGLLRELRNHGQATDALKPDFVSPGFNCRMTEFQAALGAAQLARMNDLVEARRQRARIYDELLTETGIRPQRNPEGSEHIYQSYVVVLPVEGAAARDTVIALLRAGGIESTIGTYHIPMTTYYRKEYEVEPGDFPVTDVVFARTLTLPLHHQLTREEQEVVVGSVVRALESL